MHSDGGAGDAGIETGIDGAGPTDAPAADHDDLDAAPDANPTTLCPAEFADGQRSQIAVSTAGEDRFGSISDDELTLAYSVEQGGTVRVFVAERQAVGESFTTPVALAGDFALDRAALLPDGLSLIAVNADRRAFTQFERPARDQAFQLSASALYDGIVAELGAREQVGDPVFALGGSVLLFSRYGGGRTNTVVFASRLSLELSFAIGADLTNPELEQQGAARRRPTGVSSDYSTMFYFDEVSRTSKAGSFHGSFTFYAVTDLGAVGGVQPSIDCAKLYFDAPGSGSQDLFSIDSR